MRRETNDFNLGRRAGVHDLKPVGCEILGKDWNGTGKFSYRARIFYVFGVKAHKQVPDPEFNFRDYPRCVRTVIVEAG
jgi:hypothetical protein